MEGRHIKIVGSGDPKRLASEANVMSFLTHLVSSLGMRKLGELSFDVPLEIGKLGVEPFEDEGGVTGVVVLSTSHASIHTWPLRSHFVLDVYSCRDFAPGSVMDSVTSFFGLGSRRMTDLSDSLNPIPEERRAITSP